MEPTKKQMIEMFDATRKNYEKIQKQLKKSESKRQKHRLKKDVNHQLLLLSLSLIDNIIDDDYNLYSAPWAYFPEKIISPIKKMVAIRKLNRGK